MSAYLNIVHICRPLESINVLRTDIPLAGVRLVTLKLMFPFIKSVSLYNFKGTSALMLLVEYTTDLWQDILALLFRSMISLFIQGRN